MKHEMDKLTWPASRMGDAIESLARKSGLSPRLVDMPSPPDWVMLSEDGALGRWIEGAASWLGLEAEPIETPYAEINHLIRGVAPALLPLPREKGQPRFLLLLKGQRRSVTVLGPDLAVHRVPVRDVRYALCHKIEAPLHMQLEQMLDKAGVPKRRRARAAEAILRERLSNVRAGACWLLRLSPSANFRHQMRQAHLPRRLLTLLGAHTAQYFLLLLSWWLVGQAAFHGRLDRGWLLAWALLLLTMIPLRLMATWSAGMLAIDAGGLIKQRLLFGALRLDMEEIKHQGVGQLFGRVIESEAVESLALSGGFVGLVAMIELAIAAMILSMGAGGWFHVLFLLGWCGLAVVLGWRYFRKRGRWTDARLGMTHDLVERMVGHRTRLAQEAPESRHEGEDQVLERYLDISKDMDTTAVMQALVPRGWLIVGFIGLAPAFVSGTGSLAMLAVSLGGIILAYRALQRFASVLSHLVGAAVSWKQVAPIFEAATRSEYSGLPAFDLALRPAAFVSGGRQVVIEAHDLVFRYRGRGEPVLRQCGLQVFTGDRLLLEGSSGGGKSTLGSILAGLRNPESGLLLLGGLDRGILGPEGWRQRVVSAPQFHENHVFMGTFAFNLLMGRAWPPRNEDLQEAETICRELELGSLLDRMPAGILQMVGEMGWQLSQGERSRLYIARTLLQGADLIVLDESFGALDPETLRKCLECVLNRAPSLVVIAHP